MKYLFCDTEGSIDVKSGFKTFGYVLTDENFKVIAKKEVYIDFGKGGTAMRVSLIKSKIPFNKMYCILRDNLTDPETCVLGFNVVQDVDNINAACERHKKPPLKYRFFDVQGLFMKVFQTSRLSLKDCAEFLKIEGTFEYHKSEVDAYVTSLIMQAICAHLNISIDQCISQYGEFGGYTENYKSHLNIDEKAVTLESCRADNFKIRIDFPLICFKKKIGAINEHGSRDGVCCYYDLTLDGIFKDRHPHQAAKAKNGCLVNGFFEEAKNRGLKTLEKYFKSFYYAQAQLIVNEFVVSYEFIGSISQNKLNLLFGEEHLKTIGRRNKYARLLKKYNKDPQDIVKKYYTKETFLQGMLKNAKWNFGDKNAEIQVSETVSLDDVWQEGDELFVPRTFEYALSERIGANESIACKKNYFPFACGAKVVDISELNLSDNSVQLVTKDADGNVYAYIPCKHSVRCDLFDCQYELPLLIRRKLNYNVFL